MAKNPEGNPGKGGPQEWGSKGRKEEARLRGLNNKARRNAIKDQKENS